jgi:hypothetical protein
LPILILLIILKNRAITVADLEAYRVVRCWESHIFQTVSSQMAVRLWTLCAGHTLLPKEDSWYSFML